MGRRKKNVPNNNLQIATFFVIFVGSLVVISILLKLFLLVKQSSFDGNHRFTVLLAGDGKGKKTIISVLPETQSISVLNIRGEIGTSRVGRFLESPIDGKISYPSFSGNLNQKDVEKTLGAMILGYKNLQTNLTIIDVIRLWYFSRTLLSSSTLVEEIPTTLEEGRIDKISYSFLSDPAVIKDKLSIQIINGTEITGLGNRLARFINNMGGNVIAVSTSDRIVNHSEISYVGKKTYTVERLQKVLGFLEKETQQLGVSDITITIGNESLNSLVF